MRSLVRFCVLVACCVALPISAQQPSRVSGTVRDSASSAPLAGAVVVLLDASGVTVARTLSDGAGHYALAQAGAGTRLRIIRIGFHPQTLPITRSNGAQTIADVRMTRLPPTLAPMEVTSKAVCSDAPDRRAAAALWEQARAGLLAAVVAREASPARASILTYQRALDLSDERVLLQRNRVAWGQTSRPFLAVDSPRQLAEHGYISEDNTGRVYKAPDADVLLDDSFAETHCFGVKQGDGAHPGAVGLAFEPARGRDTLVDVRGVLWMDSGVLALQLLDFRYTQVEPAAERAQTGGWVHFRAMPNGVVFIDQWALRLAVMRDDASSAASRLGQGLISSSNAGPERRLSRMFNRAVVQLSESGGAVLNATWNDSVRFRTTLAPLVGQVRAKGRSEPLAGVIVELAGTGDSATTDSAGRFLIHPVIPGRYTVHATDTAYAEYAKPREGSESALVEEGRPRDVLLELPPRTELETRVAKARASQPAVVRGRITRTTDAAPIVGVDVWVPSEDRHAKTDSSGEFRFDRLPAGQTLIEFRQIAYVARRDTISLFGGGTVTRNFVMTPMSAELDTVRTIAARTFSPALRGFQERMAQGKGYFIGDTALRQHDNERLSSIILSRTSGMTTIPLNGGGAYLASTRKACKGPVFTRCDKPADRCFVTVYMDGVRIYSSSQPGDSFPPDMDHMSVSEYAGVEFYPGGGGASAPLQYSGTDGGCGTLLLWTRER